MIWFFRAVFVLFCAYLYLHVSVKEDRRPKVLICGVCRDVEKAVLNSVNNIEELGSKFSDYAVIIYENNSKDHTADLFAIWAEKNPKVTFISEKLIEKHLPQSRPERIARARNIVLSCKRSKI